MELLCPECMGALALRDSRTVRCTVHGGQYALLFARTLPPRSAMENTPANAPGPSAGGDPLAAPPAPLPGASAGVPPDSTAATPVAVNVPAGMRCVQHPGQPATQQCQTCGGYMCATCDFVLPGGIHLCPTCATKPQTTLGPRRKKSMIWSMALAVWSTLGMVAVFGGAFAEAVDSKEAEQVLGLAMTFFVFVPAICGLAIGLGAIDRRFANPPSLWTATIWNGVIVAAFTLLCIVGLAS